MRLRAVCIVAMVVGVLAPYRVAGATTLPLVRVNAVIALESQGGKVPAIVPITLDAPSATPVTLHYQTYSVGDTATAGVDYKATSGWLTFAPGEVQKDIKVQVLPDHVQEPDEIFHVLIDDVVGATTGRVSGVVMIVDTYPPGCLIGSAVEFDAEAVGKGKTYVATVMFTIIDKFDHAVTASFRTAPYDAKPGIDYVAKSGTITIPAGQLSATVKIRLLKTTASLRRSFQVALYPIVGLPNGQTEATASVSLLGQPLTPP